MGKGSDAPPPPVGGGCGLLLQVGSHFDGHALHWGAEGAERRAQLGELPPVLPRQHCRLKFPAHPQLAADTPTVQRLCLRSQGAEGGETPPPSPTWSFV